MKKLLSIVLTLTLLVSALPAAFASGSEIAGHIYSTDIKACINGVWVDSYNIGGQTAVIVEDITTLYRYSDPLRTLVIDDLSPDYLISGKNASSNKTGEIVGNIYKTDIKTYFRGKELTSFALDGKMAVIIEELGADSTFSSIGGKYIWNPGKRTIELESMYRYPYSMRTMLEEKGYNIMLTEADSTLKAEPVPSPLYGGQILCENAYKENSATPVTYNNETIGYRCSFPDLKISQDESGVPFLKEGQDKVEYFYVDKVEDMIFKSGVITPTADDWLNYFKNHTVSTIKDTFETEDYLFLYMFSQAVMSGKDRLIKINKKDGTKLEYQDTFNSVDKIRFENVTIDRENEKVYFKYDKDYIINLKTDEVRLYEKLETDIGAGSKDGSPSLYEQTCAKNSCTEYKLISGEKEIFVKGFSVNEFYYATMLPLKETFDFLNIKYSFENDILAIDTKNSIPFGFEKTENTSDSLGENEINYLYVEKVIENGAESEITYPYISGHFDRTYEGRAKAKPYVCEGKVYINASYISSLFEDNEKGIKTPLGMIETDADLSSQIHFAVSCQAKVKLVQDKTKFAETHFVIEKNVKAFTNQQSAMLISFDDFAEIFGGEWKLQDNIFEFTYDDSKKPAPTKSEDFSDGTEGDWPNKTDALNVVDFSPVMNTIKVNGNEVPIKAQYGGKVYDSSVIIYENTLYIPVQMVAELLEFDLGYLQVLL